MDLARRGLLRFSLHL